MEEVATVFIRGLFFLIRWFIVEALIEFVFYWIGKAALLTLTLGHFPRADNNKAKKTRRIKVAREKGKIICFGIFVTILIIITAVKLSEMWGY